MALNLQFFIILHHAYAPTQPYPLYLLLRGTKAYASGYLDKSFLLFVAELYWPNNIKSCIFGIIFRLNSL